MTKLMLLAPFILISAYTAWRLSKVPADPDWSVFNFWSMTGSVYGKDFADCKTPAIHVWYWLLSKAVGQNVERIKFAHTFVVGSTAATATWLLTGNWWAALAATILTTTPSLSMQGNVGQQPAVLLIIALLTPSPWLAASAVALSVAFEPKLLPSVAIMAIVGGYLPHTALWAVAGIVGLGALKITHRKGFEGIWESSVIIPLRIARYRPSGTYINSWVPDFVRNTLIFLFPWLVVAAWQRPDPLFWLPPALFMLLQAQGKVLRWNHWTPIVAWVVAAQPDPLFVWLLATTEWVSAGFYLGNGYEILKRYYYTMADMVKDGKEAGEWLKDKEGIVWVNGLNNGVYIYAQKPVAYGMAEIMEVREAALERRERMKKLWGSHPADWVVQTPAPQVKFVPRGYKRVQSWDTAVIWQRV